MSETIYPKLVLAAGVLAAHGLIAALLSWRTWTSSAATDTTTTAEITEARVIFESLARTKVELPEVQLAVIHPSITALRAVQFEDPEDSALAGIIAPSSAPRLRTIQSVDVTFFARRAGLAPGQAKTAILVANIDEDGQANQVDIALSSGDAAADAAAVDYALALRWIPGTREHRPQPMRFRFPITLAIPR